MKNKKINQIIVVYTKQRIKNSDVRCNRRPSNKSEKPNNTCMNDSCHKLCGNIHQGERLPHHRFSNLFNVRRVEWVIFFCVCVCFWANVLSNKLQHCLDSDGQNAATSLESSIMKRGTSLQPDSVCFTSLHILNRVRVVVSDLVKMTFLYL